MRGCWRCCDEEPRRQVSSLRFGLRRRKLGTDTARPAASRATASGADACAERGKTAATASCDGPRTPARRKAIYGLGAMAAALLLQSEAGLTPAQTRARLQGAARDLGKAGPDEVFGHGLVQPAGGCIP